MTWEMHFTFRDDENHSSVVTINFADSIVTTNLAAAASAFLVVLGPLTDAAFIKATVSRVLLSGSTAPVTGADIEIGAKFFWSQVGKVKNTMQTIPAFVRSKLLPTTKKVDLADADVAAFVTAMEEGLTATTLFEPTSDEGTDLDVVVDAIENYEKARK